MPRYGLIDTGSNALLELRSYASQPPNPAGKTRKWLPCDQVAQPSFDPSTEKVTGPSYSVGASAIMEEWVKISLTAQEISDAKDAAISEINSTLYSVIAKVLLNHENRIRALESKTPITMAQFKTGIKALL